MKRTNKTQRTAYNLTNLAKRYDEFWDIADDGLLEMAKDHGIACISYGDLMREKGEQVDQEFVFVPQKDWDEAFKRYKVYEDAGIDDPKFTLRTTARHWLTMAEIHKSIRNR